MKTRAIVLMAAVIMGAATANVFAADSMKHDMQRDLHVRMGMSAGEDKSVATTGSQSATYVRRDMQSDLQALMGFAADEKLLNTAAGIKLPSDATIYKP